MTASEMFKELGYEKAEKSESVVLYTNRYGDTISFKETKHVVITPVQGCRSLTMTCLFENAIHKQCKELGWFEEEKQETKQETNFEYYKDEILEDYAHNLAVVKGRPTLCYKTNCNDCDFKINQIGCREKAKDWLKQPHEKPVYKLTKFEYDLLRTNNMSHDKRLNDFATYENLREIGYFKDVNFDLTIDEILENCEIKGEENYDEINY